MSFKELLVSEDKCKKIISRQMEVIVFIILCNILDLMFTKSLPFTDWDVHFSVFAGTTS